jgi:flagellar biogenesis protein FliO
MKSMPKWFLLPPAAALLLVFGPLSMQSGAATPPEPVVTTAGDEKGGASLRERASRSTFANPKTPDFWQIGSTLIAVLVLGVGGVAVLRRLRNGPAAPRGANLMTLRQTLRLSGQRAVHAIEFDDRILLVGENERGLQSIDSGKATGPAADEAEVLLRSAPHAEAEAEEEGATPRNLLIPRPERPPTKLPTPPIDPQPRTPSSLGDFRTLLQKAGRS